MSAPSTPEAEEDALVTRAGTQAGQLELHRKRLAQDKENKTRQNQQLNQLNSTPPNHVL